MKISLKAVLLSALLFPGAGHLFLKKYLHTLILMSGTLAIIFYITANIVEKLSLIAENIESGNSRLNITSVSNLLTTQFSTLDLQHLNNASMILLILWIIGTLDSYRIGRSQDKNNVL